MSEPQFSSWAETLKLFVDRVGTIPPREAYHGHPAFDPLYNAIIKRKCVPAKHWSAGTAIEMLRTTLTDHGVLEIEGFREPEEARSEVRERISNMRSDPHARRMRGEMWRYWQRQKLLIADLLEKSPPSCPCANEVWVKLRETYIPDLKDIGEEIDWTR